MNQPRSALVGTVAEIGVGQEGRALDGPVGGVAGTIAKSVSTYGPGPGIWHDGHGGIRCIDRTTRL